MHGSTLWDAAEGRGQLQRCPCGGGVVGPYAEGRAGRTVEVEGPRGRLHRGPECGEGGVRARSRGRAMLWSEVVAVVEVELGVWVGVMRKGQGWGQGC